MLKEAEAGAKTADLARRYGVSEATICNWKAKYGRLEVSEARPLRDLESENVKLKRLLRGSGAGHFDLGGLRVVRELTQLIAQRAKPGLIVSDKGTEHTSKCRTRVVRPNRPRVALHRAGQADAERLRRELQRSHARRTAERGPVPQHDPCTGQDRSLSRGL